MTKAFKCDNCGCYYDPYRFREVKRTNSDQSYRYLYPTGRVGTASEGMTGRELDFCRACLLGAVTEALKETA